MANIKATITSRGAKITPQAVLINKADKTDVGLSNVDNTSDANKPLSTAEQTALNLKATIASPTFTGTVAIPNVANLETAVVANTAKVTANTANVTAAGALMDSECTDLAAVKAFTGEATATADQTDTEIRTAVEAATDSNVFTDDDHTKLNTIEASADVTDTANVTAAGALMDSELAGIAAVKAFTGEAAATADQTDAEIRAAVEAATDSNVFTDADHTKFNAIEALADVTDTTNVVASLTAGTNITIASNGTISSIATQFPFYKTNGVADSITMALGEFPFYKTNGTADNINILT